MLTKKIFTTAGLVLSLLIYSCGTISTADLEQSIKSEFQKKLASDSLYIEFEMTVLEVSLTEAKPVSASQTGAVEAEKSWWARLIDAIKGAPVSFDGVVTVLYDYDRCNVPITAEASGAGHSWELAPAAFDFLKNAVYIPMIPVKGDEFRMGCTSEHGSDCYNKESPAHIVTLSDFLIGKYPVTQRQWMLVMGDNPSEFKGDSLPVESVDWNDAHNFIKKLNAMSNKRYRLPTEAEWEYAARGGIMSEGVKYAGSGNAEEVAWYDENSEETTHPVGTKGPNELGIYDMSGNVAEWVEDRYGVYTDAPRTNPTGPSSGSTRVNRGGSWDVDARYCRTSNRNDNTPESRYNSLGFRLARSVKSQ
jgi:formylglycine-generating enzyme required for sulfatase activity